jgi:hypothetical protein
MAPRGFVETPLSFRRQHNNPREARDASTTSTTTFSCALLDVRLALPFLPESPVNAKTLVLRQPTGSTA